MPSTKPAHGSEELLCVKLDEDTAEELEATEELLEATDELLDDETSNELLDEEPPKELELTPTGEELLYSSFKGGGGSSRSDMQEKSSEVQSTAARVIEQGKSFFIVLFSI